MLRTMSEDTKGFNQQNEQANNKRRLTNHELWRYIPFCSNGLLFSYTGATRTIFIVLLLDCGSLHIIGSKESFLRMSILRPVKLVCWTELARLPWTFLWLKFKSIVDLRWEIFWHASYIIYLIVICTIPATRGSCWCYNGNCRITGTNTKE